MAKKVIIACQKYRKILVSEAGLVLRFLDYSSRKRSLTLGWFVLGFWKLVLREEKAALL